VSLLGARRTGQQIAHCSCRRPGEQTGRWQETFRAGLWAGVGNPKRHDDIPAARQSDVTDPL
jgi:hypothetical protein